MDDSSKIIEAIVDGNADENLAGIASAVEQRKRAIAFRKAATLKTGDRVKIVGNIRPKYLIGLEGEVAGPVEGDKLPVKLGPEAFRYAGTTRTPISCLELVTS